MKVPLDRVSALDDSIFSMTTELRVIMLLATEEETNLSLHSSAFQFLT